MPHRQADALQALGHAVEIGDVAGLEVAGLQQHIRGERAGPFDRDLPQFVALPFVHRDRHVHSLDVLGRLRADLRERYAHPAAPLIQRPDGVVQHFAEPVLGVRRADGDARNGLSQYGLRNYVVALKRHLRHRGQVARRPEHDRKFSWRRHRHAPGNFFRHALRRQEFLDPLHVPFEHRLSRGHLGHGKQRVLGCQSGLEILLRDFQLFKNHRVDLLHLGHLKGGGIAFSVGPPPRTCSPRFRTRRRPPACRAPRRIRACRPPVRS